MGKRVAAWIVLTCCGLAGTASGLSAEDYALAGRMHLSQGTATGVRQAYEIFDAAIDDGDCPDCRGNCELVFLRAVTQVAMLFIDHNDVLVSRDLLELAEGCGVALVPGVFEGLGAGASCRQIGPCLLPPEHDPDHVRRVLAESILPQFASILSELDSIDQTAGAFAIVMRAEETGVTGGLEIDYGDVVILKGLLLAYRGMLTMQVAGTSEPYVYRETVGPFDFDDAPAGAGLLLAEVRRLMAAAAEDHLFDNAAAFAYARQDWLDAINCWIDAIEYVALENGPEGTDPQANELTYIEPSAQPHLEVYVHVLMSLREALQWDMTSLDGLFLRRAYDVRDSGSAPIGELVLVFDGVRFEGHRGRLTLADGDVLEVDWFGLLDGNRVGVSLFGPEHGVEAWLEGDIDSDRSAIGEAFLDCWAADGHVPAEPAGLWEDALYADETTRPFQPAFQDQKTERAGFEPAVP
ncbi:MAG: hypothetical protein RBR19_06970 [Sedimentisphaerales bacterium]|nr:hypothetical protein [Sedimentisphaerales bacterium]